INTQAGRLCHERSTSVPLVFLHLELQQSAWNLPIEQMDLPRWPYPDLPREESIAGENEHPPTLTDVSKHVAHLLVKAFQFLLLANAFAIRGIAKQHAGGAVRRAKIAQILDV